jgi:hypothetical protein
VHKRRGLEALRKAGIDTTKKANTTKTAVLLEDEWVLAPEALAKNVLRMHLCARTFDPVLQVDTSGIGRAFEPDHVPRTILFVQCFPTQACERA